MPASPVPLTRRRWYLRNERLRELGYRDYAHYLSAPHWRDTRERYRASDRPQACYCCEEAEDVQLHHLTYERIGAELLEDLVALCRACHAAVHALERRGDLALDLNGLMDAARAREGRAFLERLAAASEAQRANSVQDRIAHLEELSPRDRILRVRAAAKARNIGISREMWMVEKLMREGRSMGAVLNKLRAVEAKVHGRGPVRFK